MEEKVKKGNKTLTVKMMLATSLSGRDGRRVKKKWSAKKRIPLGMKMPRNMRKWLKKLTKFMGLFILTAAAVFATAGCSSVSYVEPEETAVVSALGFDVSEKGVTVTVQTAEKGGKSVKVISGEGESVSFALAHLSGGDERRTELSHCAVIAVGDGIEGNRLAEIFDLCEGEADISDAVLFVGTHDANALLSLDGAAGFDMVNAMRPFPDGSGLFSKNRFYEIKSSEVAGLMALPYFYITDGEYALRGLKLYMSYGESTILDRRESALYLMMRGIFTSGKVDHFRGDTAVTSPVKRVRTFFESTENTLTVTCELTVGKEMTEDERLALAESCREGASELYSQLTSRYGNVFGYKDLIKREGAECIFRFTVI